MSSRLDWRGWTTLTLWVILCVGCMAVMLWWAAGKSIAIADMTSDEQGSVNVAETEEVEQYRLTLVDAAEKPRHFMIPVSPTIRAEQISIENRYMERQLWVYIQGGRAADYREYVLEGDMSSVVGGWAQQQGETAILKLQMDTIQEYSSVMEENRLYVECARPEEIYDRIVVIDPRCGGEEYGQTSGSRREKNIVLQIARCVRRLLDGSDIKVYLTRQEDVEVSLEDRVGLVREVNADFYVGIGVNVNEEEPEQFGTETWYNGEYFIPEFGSLQLADLLERQVTGAVVGRANGLMQTDDPVLERLTIPGALLKAGYLTHEREGELLTQEGYAMKVAEGIVAALRGAFDEQLNPP